MDEEYYEDELEHEYFLEGISDEEMEMAMLQAQKDIEKDRK